MKFELQNKQTVGKSTSFTYSDDNGNTITFRDDERVPFKWHILQCSNPIKPMIDDIIEQHCINAMDRHLYDNDYNKAIQTLIIG